MPVDFTLPPDVEEVRLRVRKFMDTNVRPEEERLESNGADRGEYVRTIVGLREKAKGEGLWNPHLPPEWDGVRIVQLTDLHLGIPGAPYGMLERAVAATLALKPELIALTGDYSHDGTPRPLDLLAPLAKTAPTIAVLGNHDYYQRKIGADLIVKELERQGIGRPSTYAATIGTIERRGYVFRQGKALVPSFTAFAVTHLLLGHFSDLIDLGFTA